MIVNEIWRAEFVTVENFLSLLLMNWVLGGRMLSQPSSSQFFSTLWIWCHSAKLIILRRLFVPNEVLLKVWVPNIEKFQIREAFSPSALGGVVIITPDTCLCPKLMVWLLQEFGLTSVASSGSRIKSRCVGCAGTDGHRSGQPQINVSKQRSDLSVRCFQGKY